MRADRDHYLPALYARKGPFRLPRLLRIRPGEELKDVTFRMEPWAVIDGKVRFFDNTDPALGVPVFLYRKTFYRGKQMYSIAGRTRTDDRGYYRIPGLAPGSYYLAAIYDRPIAPVREDRPLEAPEREPSYASVFYPSGYRIGDALPIRLHAGQELTGLDMFLEKAESVRVTGSVTDGCTGQLTGGSNIEISRVDDDGTTLSANADVRQLAGSYTIRGLTQGTYVVTATLGPTSSGSPRCAGRVERRLLTIGAEPVSDFRLMLVQDRVTQFEVFLDGKPVQISPADLRFEPKTPGWPSLAAKRADPLRRGSNGPLEVELIHQETYEIFFERLPGIDVWHAPPYTIQGLGLFQRIHLRSDGGKVTGTVLDGKKDPVPGAAVTFIPETMQPQLYREGYVDRDGLFQVQGLAPGRYLAVPWMDSPPCDIQNRNEILDCAAKGKTITVKAGEQSLLELDLKVN